MLDIFKTKSNQPEDVKSIRSRLMQFIKEQLQRWEGGEGSMIKGMQLFCSPSADEQHIYEAALYADDPSKLRNDEIQKIIDDYALDLPHAWTLDLNFTDNLPVGSVKHDELPFAIHVITNKKAAINKPRRATVTVLNGVAEKKEYVIEADDKKICIGRERETQTTEGFHRTNNIAFPGDAGGQANQYISRQHAHIEWNEESGSFYFFADAGGIPPRNKVKVRRADGTLIKLQTIEIGHQLEDGDQIILGESALLEVSIGGEGD